MLKGGNKADKVMADDKVDLCGRGLWWLRTLKDTPVPGLYHIRDFIEEAELNPVKKTYGFKGTGRKDPILGGRKGDLLLPGVYEHRDSTQEVLMRQASYSFKSCPRPDIVTLGVRDKHINTSPCDYNVTARPVEKVPCKDVMFRSTVQRICFPPKEGPSPCHYSPQLRPANGISSCFKSTLPRLHSVHSKTPGPGTYDPRWKLCGHQVYHGAPTPITKLTPFTHQSTVYAGVEGPVDLQSYPQTYGLYSQDSIPKV